MVIPFKRTKEGYLDYFELSKIAYNTLKLPYGALEDMVLDELLILYRGSLEVQKEEMEMLYHVVRTGVASGFSGKDIKLFDEKKQNNSKKSSNITQEERTNTLENLGDIFKQ